MTRHDTVLYSKGGVCETITAPSTVQYNFTEDGTPYADRVFKV